MELKVDNTRVRFLHMLIDIVMQAVYQRKRQTNLSWETLTMCYCVDTCITVLYD